MQLRPAGWSLGIQRSWDEILPRAGDHAGEEVCGERTPDADSVVGVLVDGKHYAVGGAETACEVDFGGLLVRLD